MIWKVPFTIADINNRCAHSLCDHLDIQFTEIGSDYLVATMPVDKRTMQPMGILHGGASCALAETIASAAANCCIDPHKIGVGLDLNINHIRQVQGGMITAVARPFHLGKTTQVWDIKITNEKNELVAVARLTVAVIEKKPLSDTKSLKG